MKKIILLLLSAFSLSGLQAQKSFIKRDSQYPQVYYNASKFPQGLKNISFEQILIAWDLNGVIFKKEYSIPANLYQLAVTDGHGWMYTFKILASFGKLWRYKTHLKKQHDPRGYVWDAMFRTIETSEEGKKVATLLRSFSQQANILNYETVSILQELADNGHRNVVLSNMGTGLVELQVNLLKRTLEKDTMPPAQRAATEFTISFLTNTKHNVVASPENNWLHKPMRNSYKSCLQKNQVPHKRVTIFVDDKKKNIEPALTEGLFDIAILFTTPKNLRKLLNLVSKGQIGLNPQDIHNQTAVSRIA